MTDTSDAQLRWLRVSTAEPDPTGIPALQPADEEQRLAAVHALRLLDTPPEERFDRVTRTAQRLLDTPIALVTLVDTNRQWFKSCQGLGVPETERGVSFCAYAIHSDDPFVISDARSDARFAGNSLVTGPPFIRAYAGVPLHGPRNHRVGTLCVIDPTPRYFTAGELDALRDVARWAEAELNRTELADALAARWESEERLQALMEAVPDGVATFDSKGRIRQINPAGERLFGYTVAHLLDRDVRVLLVEGEARDLLVQRIRTLGPDDEPVRAAIDGCHADGRAIPLELTVSATAFDGQRGFVVTARDVTERRVVEQMKDEFISVVSHELRTPLTSIRGSLGLLAGGALGPLSDDGQRMAEIAVSDTDRLVRMVNEMLDLERMKSGRVELRRGEVAVTRLVHDAAAAVEGMAEEAGVAVRVTATTASVRVDGDRMVQAVANLLSNAIKFSAPGQTVDVTAGRDGGWLQVEVVDRGRGIPADMRERIFHRFQQVDASDARERGGTGLGLAIVRTIAEQHGGTVTVESTPGQGSVFTIRVPVPESEADMGQATAVASDPGAEIGAPAGRRVLVIDDDADIREVALLALETVGGLAVRVAASGAEGIRLAVADPPDAILLDVMMPEMDGPTTLARLRDHPVTTSVPVLFLTAKAQASEREQLQALGVAGTIAKPFDPMTVAADVSQRLGWS